MIQRIQSVFLLLAALLLFIAVFSPVWKNNGTYTGTNSHGIIQLDAFKTGFIPMAGDGDPLPDEAGKAPELSAGIKISDNIYIGVLLGLAGLNALFIIFQYKKRQLQIKLCALNYLLLSGALCACYFSIKEANSLLTDVGKGQFLFGFYVPVIAIVLHFLAIRFIRKDEALVRSVDRIR